MIQVISVRYIKQYQIYIKFNDQKEGTLDLKDVIAQDPRPIFKALIDLQQFKKFKVAADTIVWENGLDLAPEFLYQKLQDKNK